MLNATQRPAGGDRRAREYTLTFTDLAFDLRAPRLKPATPSMVESGGASTLRVFRGIGKAFDLSGGHLKRFSGLQERCFRGEGQDLEVCNEQSILK